MTLSSIEDINYCCGIMNRRDKATALIDFIHKYGTDVNQYTEFVQNTHKVLVTNCYWGGMFGELGMRCNRCGKRTHCQYIVHCVYRHPVPPVKPRVARRRSYW